MRGAEAQPERARRAGVRAVLVADVQADDREVDVLDDAREQRRRERAVLGGVRRAAREQPLEQRLHLVLARAQLRLLLRPAVRRLLLVGPQLLVERRREHVHVVQLDGHRQRAELVPRHHHHDPADEARAHVHRQQPEQRVRGA